MAGRIETASGRRRWRKAALLAGIASALLAVGAWAQQATLREPSTGTLFAVHPVVEGVTYTCLGTGVRKIMTAKVYANTYCLSNPAVATDFARARHAGQSGSQLASALANDTAFFQTLATAPANKLVALHMVRDVSRDRLAGAFRDSLSKLLPPNKVDLLVNAIPGDARKGEEALLYASGPTLVINIGGRANRINDAQIANTLWQVWLGPNSVTPGLKESIAQHVSEQVTAVGGAGAAAPQR